MNLKKTSKLVLGLSAKIVFWIVCLAVFIFICSKAFSFGHMIFSNEAMAKEGQGKEVTVTIPEGASDMTVADLLLEDELIENKYVFAIQAKLFEAEFHAGEFVLNTEDGPEDIIEILSRKEKEE